MHARISKKSTFHVVWLLALLLPITAWTVSKQTTNTQHSEVISQENDIDDERLYQFVFVSMKDPATFQEYGTKMGPIVSKIADGRGHHQIIHNPEEVWGDWIPESLSFINLVSYSSAAAEAAFNKDPEFLKIKPLRDTSIDMIAFNANLVSGELIAGADSNRVYMLEFSYYKEGGPDAYEAYFKEAVEAMSKHGFHVEARFKPTAVSGVDLPLPDVINVMYFENQEGKDHWDTDPRHEDIGKHFQEAAGFGGWVNGHATF